MRDFVAALQGTNVTAECEASTGDQANGVYMYQDPDCAQGGLGCTGTNNCRFCKTPSALPSLPWLPCPAGVPATTAPVGGATTAPVGGASTAPVGPTAGDGCSQDYTQYPDCAGRMAWMRQNWSREPYLSAGVTGQDCSIQQYLYTEGMRQTGRPYCPACSCGAGPTVGPGPPTGAPGIPEYTPEAGVIQAQLQNVTNGAVPDNQIYFAVLGRNPTTHRFSYLRPDGTMVECSVNDNGPLDKGTLGPYSNYFWTLADSKTLRLPMMDSGRIFVSIRSPMYIKILTDAAGNVSFQGPNVANPTDPNIDVYFDWYEFTFNNGGLWINTTQVDQFSFPLTVAAFGNNRTWQKRAGITETRDAIFAAFPNEVPTEFQGCMEAPYRISAPCKTPTFDHGYIDSYVDEIWEYFKTHELKIAMWNNSRHFTGRVTAADQFEFYEDSDPNGPKYYIRGKPTTEMAFEGSGYLASGDPGQSGQEVSVQLAIQAQFCAALNRHIADDGSKWGNSETFYPGYPTAKANYYARFWHLHNIDGLAYGFAYDDVSDQSSTVHTPYPEYLILGVGW